jgi:hypothetical protein
VNTAKLLDLSGFPGRATVLGATLGALSTMLVRERLIPENADSLGATAVLAIIAAIFASLHDRERLHRCRRYLITAAIVGIAIVLLIQVLMVARVEPYGPDKGQHTFLIGLQLSERGQEWQAMYGTQTNSALVRSMGDDLIPAAWGWSYNLVVTLYSLGYLGAVFCLVLLFGIPEHDKTPGAPAEVAKIAPGAQV